VVNDILRKKILQNFYVHLANYRFAKYANFAQFCIVHEIFATIFRFLLDDVAEMEQEIAASFSSPFST
jgi:hypothetical protein